MEENKSTHGLGDAVCAAPWQAMIAFGERDACTQQLGDLHAWFQ